MGEAPTIVACILNKSSTKRFIGKTREDKRIQSYQFYGAIKSRFR